MDGSYISLALLDFDRHADVVDERMKDVIDAAWCSTFGITRTTLRTDGIHVVIDETDSNDIACLRLDDTCVIRVPALKADAASQLFQGLSADEAFAAGPLEDLASDDGQVFGPSWHHYGDARSLRPQPDPLTRRVSGDDLELRAFLQSNSVEDWAESGFPEDPTSAEPSETTFYLRSSEGAVVAAGNMTDWRGLPADVGVLVGPSERGRGHAIRLAGAMIVEALPLVDVVRYRALSTNLASLAVADRLGFERYGGNFIVRLTPQ